MFELNEAIEQWRRELRAGGVRRREVLDELESHLHEDLDHLTGEGLGEEEAFRQAAQRLGESERLGAEFRKARGVKGKLLELIGGENLEMEENGHNRFATRLIATLFMIYVALTLLGWGCLLADENTVPAYVGQAVGPLLFFSVIMALVGGAIGMGIREYKQERKLPIALGPRTAGMVLVMVAALPFFLYSLLGTAMTVPFWITGWLKPESSRIVRLVASRDGHWQAYVVARPAFDGPNHDLVLRRPGQPAKLRVARLMGDVDWNKAVMWSPGGDLVVFSNQYNLFALRVVDMKSAVVPLGGRQVWHGGTFSIDCRRLREVSGITFPRAGVVSYTLKDTHEVKTIPPEAFKRRPAAFAVNPFAPDPG